ncbi:MAG TPA: fused MFS/spermidine synthase [Chloroflexota bacterium]|nr:fused MFS/spermidine synthase [Chloroflexota bacterium]
MLPLLVVVAGMAAMAVEMAASRLIAPYFGTSLYIWGVLIGLVLVYLSAGYWVGGLLADRHPRKRIFLGIMVLAGLAIAAVAWIAPGVLALSEASTQGLRNGVVWGAILGCLLLFSVPTMLLGSLNPFAVRLSLSGVTGAGRASGTVFGLTTLGSLAGTFGSVFYLMPSYGTRATLLLTAACTVAASLLGSWLWRAPA